MEKQVCVKPPPAVNMMLPTFAAERWRLQNDAHSRPTAIDQYLLPTGHSAANLLSSIDWTDRWMATPPLL